jgi:hypothetical protein
MGFSPGSFTAKVHAHDLSSKNTFLHFERKADGRIVLWSFNETASYFEVDLENAALMISQLETLLATEV